MEVPQLEKLAEKELKAAIKRIKQKPPKNLDELFYDWHDETFEKIDCLTCANCCKTTSPMFFEKDIERLSSYFKIRPAQFIEKYLFLDTDGIWALKTSPCPFLGSDNYCSVYDFRQKACRVFPPSNQRKMHTHFHLIHQNIKICPAVVDIAKKLMSI
jgi:Fe-S-cluster containining protein